MVIIAIVLAIVIPISSTVSRNKKDSWFVGFKEEIMSESTAIVGVEFDAYRSGTMIITLLCNKDTSEVEIEKIYEILRNKYFYDIENHVSQQSFLSRNRNKYTKLELWFMYTVGNRRETLSCYEIE